MLWLLLHAHKHAGAVYLARDILSGQHVALKLEPIDSEHETLEHEFYVYRKLCGGVGIPQVHWFGTEYGFNALAMDKLGQSLEALFIQCDFRFSVQTVLHLACQLVRNHVYILCSNTSSTNHVCHVQLHRLQYIHSRNFIHRDLKPSNIVMGIGKKASMVYLIDFGLSKQYRDTNTHLHIPCINGHGLTGTAVFTSIRSHLGWELGRRDDLESLAYVLIYFLRGSLPWQSLGHQDIEGEDSVLKIKQQITPHDLCHGLPVEFSKFLEYTHLLSFDDKPDYNYLRSLFEDRFSQEGFDNLSFDWSSSDSEDCL